MKTTVVVKFYQFARFVKSEALEHIADLRREYEDEAFKADANVKAYLAAIKKATEAEKTLAGKLVDGTATDADFDLRDATRNAQATLRLKLDTDETNIAKALIELNKKINKARQSDLLINPCDRVALSIPGETKLYRCEASVLSIITKDAGRSINVDIVRDANNVITSVTRC